VTFQLPAQSNPSSTFAHGATILRLSAFLDVFRNFLIHLLHRSFDLGCNHHQIGVLPLQYALFTLQLLDDLGIVDSDSFSSDIYGLESFLGMVNPNDANPPATMNIAN